MTELEAALESCLTLMRDEELSLEDCLERYPQHREELERLLPVAIRLRQGHSLGASERLRASLASRLQAMKPLQSENSSGVLVTYRAALRSIFRTRDSVSQRRALMIPALVTFLIVIIFSMGGLVAGADAAGPGDLLFGLDTAIEGVRLSFADDQEKESELRIEFATERLEELKFEIEGEGDQQDIEAALLEFQEALATLEALLGELTPEQRSAFDDAFALLIASSQDISEFEFEFESVADHDQDDLDNNDLDEADLDDDELDGDDLDDDDCDSSVPGGSDSCGDEPDADGPDDDDDGSDEENEPDDD